MSILAGAIRPAHRLAAAGLVPTPRCPFCYAPREDQEHVFWACVFWQEIRQIWTQRLQHLVDQTLDKHPYLSNHIQHLLQLPCVRNCGIFPGDPHLIADYDAIPDHRADIQLTPLAQLTSEQRSGEWHQYGYIRIFTDGGACHLTIRLLRRIGSGIYFGRNHPCNGSIRGDTKSQTVYRAELLAIHIVIRHAREPSWITLDNKAVADQAHALTLGQPLTATTDLDLWEPLVHRIAMAGPAFFKITWITSHMEGESLTQAINQGSITQQEADWNAHADKLATTAYQLHTFTSEFSIPLHKSRLQAANISKA